MDVEQQFEEGTTLDRFLMETLMGYPGATGTFVNLMQSVALAGKLISSRVNRAGLAGMIGGTLTMEALFGLPGIGRLALDSVRGRDYPLVQAVIVVIALGVVAANLLADLAQRLLDPRLR